MFCHPKAQGKILSRVVFFKSKTHDIQASRQNNILIPIFKIFLKKVNTSECVIFKCNPRYLICYDDVPVWYLWIQIQCKHNMYRTSQEQGTNQREL